jgi:hypothetical protein
LHDPSALCRRRGERGLGRPRPRQRVHGWIM